MGPVLAQIVVRAQDPPIQAMWWSAALGWQRSPAGGDDWSVHPHRDEPGVPFLFVAAPAADGSGNRLHWELPTGSAEEFDGQVEALRRGGARRAVDGPDDVPGQALSDPEGNRFRVLAPRPGAGVRPVAALVLVAHDPAALATFWQQTLGWQPVDGERPTLASPSGTGPRLAFARPAASPAAGAPSPGTGTVRSGVHLDLSDPAGAVSGAQVERLFEAGAQRVHPDHQDGAGLVLTDPQGTPFRVLRQR